MLLRLLALAAIIAGVIVIHTTSTKTGEWRIVSARVKKKKKRIILDRDVIYPLFAKGPKEPAPCNLD